jgi:hypothetical protein
MYKLLVGKPEGERPLRRPRHKWEDNIKMDIRDIGWEWTGLILLRLGAIPGCCEHRNEPLGSKKGGKFLDLLSDC